MMADDKKPDRSAQTDGADLDAGSDSVLETKPSQPADMDQADEDVLPSEAKKTPRTKSRLGPWLFLLLIFFGLPAAWLLSPPEIRQQAHDLLNDLMPTGPTYVQQATPPAVGHDASTSRPQAQVPTSKPAALSRKTDSVMSSEPKPTIIASPTTDEDQATVGHRQEAEIDSDSEAAEAEIEELRRQNDQLQVSISTVLTERDALRQELANRQQHELRSRLQWLSRAGAGLAQHATWWTDIAALPKLGEADKIRATKMARLADDDLDKLHGWRKALKHLAESIPNEQQADIFPKPENRYFAWLLGAFHLRQAPNEAQENSAGLHHLLLSTEHSLAYGDWPEPRQWRGLISSLRSQLGDEVDLGLPESLLPMQRDLDAMRVEAAEWLEGL